MDYEKDDSGISSAGMDVERGTLMNKTPVQDIEGIQEIQNTEKEVQKRQDNSLSQPDPEFEVRFAADDPEDPRNFSNATKAGLTLLLGLLAFVASFGSSIVAPAQTAIAADMHMSEEATVLLMSLFLLGYVVGPMLWAPISEAYGRRWSMLPAMAVLGLFSLGSATSHTPAALLITRLLGGVFSSAPVSNVTAALGDLYAPRWRGIAMAFYSVCVLGGPCVAPTVGAAIVVNPHLGWRWTFYLEAILALGVAVISLPLLTETYVPVLLGRRAARLRATPLEAGGDPRFWHPHDLNPVTLQTVFRKHLARPLHMFVSDPIVACIALYASFVYALVYLALEVYPIVFREERGMSPVESSLPFLGLFVGACLAVGINLSNQPLYLRAMARNNGHAVPEARLPPIVIGGCLFAGGFFWFGWTAAPRFPWPVPTVAGVFIGAGFNVVFQQCLNYLVDTYGRYAASATSANTMLRSLFACGLPLAASPMFHRMGVGPAASLLGGISAIMIPVPFLFMQYGPRLRAMSKFVD